MKYCLLFLFGFSAFGLTLEEDQIELLNNFINLKKYEELEANLFSSLNDEKLKTFLEQDRLSPDDLNYLKKIRKEKDSLDNNFLHYCAARGKIEFIKQFSIRRIITLEWDGKNKFGLTPLAMAIIFRQQAIVEILIKKDYDRNPVFCIEELPTVLGLISLKRKINDPYPSYEGLGLSAFNTAVYFGNKEVVEFYLAQQQDSYSGEINNIGNSLFLARYALQDEIFDTLIKYPQYEIKLRFCKDSLAELEEKIALFQQRRPLKSAKTALENHPIELSPKHADDEDDSSNDEPWDGDEEFIELLESMKAKRSI